LWHVLVFYWYNRFTYVCSTFCLVVQILAQAFWMKWKIYENFGCSTKVWVCKHWHLEELLCCLFPMRKYMDVLLCQIQKSPIEFEFDLEKYLLLTFFILNIDAQKINYFCFVIYTPIVKQLEKYVFRCVILHAFIDVIFWLWETWILIPNQCFCNFIIGWHVGNKFINIKKLS
jgi:hypothetical protein